jgi:hypothetical protein
MAEFPICRNFKEHRGCSRSQVVMLGEGDDHYTFRCETCRLEFVCSKTNAIARSALLAQQENLRRRMESRRRHDSGRKIFT